MKAGIEIWLVFSLLMSSKKDKEFPTDVLALPTHSEKY